MIVRNCPAPASDIEQGISFPYASEGSSKKSKDDIPKERYVYKAKTHTPITGGPQNRWTASAFIILLQTTITNRHNNCLPFVLLTRISTTRTTNCFTSILTFIHFLS